MIRLVKKYGTVLRAGLVVLRVRVLLRVKSLPLVLDRLNPRSMAGGLDEAVMGDLVYYVDRWLQLFPYNTRGNCFPRSLFHYWFARRLGYGSFSLWGKKRIAESRRPCLAHIGSPAFSRDRPVLVTFYRHLFVSSRSRSRREAGFRHRASKRKDDDLLKKHFSLPIPVTMSIILNRIRPFIRTVWGLGG